MVKVLQERQALSRIGKDKKRNGGKEAFENERGRNIRRQDSGDSFRQGKFNDLADDFLADYRINGKKSLNRAELVSDN